MHKFKTYNVIPREDKSNVRKITCNSLEECAATAKIFFLLPCDIELVGQGMVASVSATGQLHGK